jgi:tRNA (guanine37-N1)-methyltransferase
MSDVFHAYDVFGNIALVKFSKDVKLKAKKQFARRLLCNKSIKTVLEKTGKFSGRLRKQETKYIAGEKTKEVLYRENGCVFRFNIDTTYFSPRLSNERKEVALEIKKGENVLVMFAGVGPFPIVIARNSKAGKVYSNEINREANKYAELNIELNKVKDKVVLLPGDIKKVADKLLQSAAAPTSTPEKATYIPKKFNTIVMPRPRLKDSFLEEAFMLSKKGARIYYYDFCKDDEIDAVVEKVKTEAKRARKRIKILNVKKAGEIAPYKFRIRVDFVVASN